MNATVSYSNPQPGFPVIFLVIADGPGGGVHAVCAFEDSGDADQTAISWSNTHADAQVVPVMILPPGTELRS
jgi:hypothetical protein